MPPPERKAESGVDRAVAEYKTILRSVLDQRPSGTRQRLAAALGKNRSFVSQISNPNYAVPIPASHLETIFELCHFSAETRERFLAAYRRAHPRRFNLVSDAPPMRAHTIYLPDLGDEGKNRKLDALVADFVGQLARIIKEPD